MDARNAIEYNMIERHMIPPHSLVVAYDKYGDIVMRCSCCGEVVLIWDKPEREENDG